MADDAATSNTRTEELSQESMVAVFQVSRGLHFRKDHNRGWLKREAC